IFGGRSKTTPARKPSLPAGILLHIGLAIVGFMKRFALCLFLAICSVSGDPPAWVAKSNQNAQMLIVERARFFPEVAGAGGLSGVDDQIIDLKPESTERQIEAGKGSLKT